jgi:hypothetical protein
MAQPYTPYAVQNGKPRNGLAASQAGVVRAVQEWLVENHPELDIQFTKEDFTRESLLNDGFDYHLVVTNTRNPSWYVVKPKAATSVRTEFTNTVAYMTAHPQRAYFADLFRLGGFRSGAEVGVASGRFSEHMLKHANPEQWIMVEPFPNQNLASRLPIVRSAAKYNDHFTVHEPARETWVERGISVDTNITFLPCMSLDDRVMNAVPTNSLDFVYLDGAHDYENVKGELEPWFERVRPGGILAGHDYQHHGEFKALACRNCQTVPMAKPYTPYAVQHGKPRNGLAASQAGVVRAVQEWLVENHPELDIQFTKEDFTRESLLNDGFDYDLVVTNTRNPSWYVVKPKAATSVRKRKHVLGRA